MLEMPVRDVTTLRFGQLIRMFGLMYKRQHVNEAMIMEKMFRNHRRGNVLGERCLVPRRPRGFCDVPSKAPMGMSPQSTVSTGMPHASVRHASVTDVNNILSIENSLEKNGNWSYEDILEEVKRERSLVLVVEKDACRSVVGWAVGWLVPPDEFQVLEVAVHQAEQGNGFGKKLMVELLEEVRLKNVTIALLEVRASNDRAISLYAHAGFEVVGRRKKYYRDGEDALLMNLILS